jgi:hypothetical protein
MDNATVSSLYCIALDKKLNHLSFQSTEQLKNNTFLTWYRHLPRKMVGSDSRYADATHLTLRRYQVKKQSVHVNVMSYRCSFRDIQWSKRRNTINFLFQILLF